MPDIANGRERVNAFLKEKGIKKTTLAVAYGFKRQEVTNILSGTTKGPRANSFILQVIEDYGIEQEKFEEQEGERDRRSNRIIEILNDRLWARVISWGSQRTVSDSEFFKKEVKTWKKQLTRI